MRVRGRWPDNLFPFDGTGGRSGAIMKVDMGLLTKADFTVHLQCEDSYSQIRKIARR